MINATTTNTADKASGCVVTFYSFKGGVGRSMALANVAVLLARAGKKVLCLDWDLEAPGLDRYFCAAPFTNSSAKPTLTTPSKVGGLLDILQRATPEDPSPWRDYVRRRVSADQLVTLDFIGSGEDTGDYSTSLGEFNWSTFFECKRGGDTIEALRREWKAVYDYVLVDSRTGLTDASGICTIQMPDVLILLFAANQQNVDWCARVAEGIRKGRRALPYDRPFLPIVPVLARFDASEESDRAALAKTRISERFGIYFQDWLPRGIAPREMLNWSVFPYVPRYSFEEALAVEDEPASGALGLSFYYDLLAKLLLSRFQDVRDILARVGVPGAALPPLLPSVSELRSELRRDIGAAGRYRQAILAKAEERPQDVVDALEILAQMVRPAEAEQLLADAIALLQDPVMAQLDEVPRLMSLRGAALASAGRIAEAEQVHRKAVEQAQNLFGSQDIHTAQAQSALATFLAWQNRKTEAAQYYALAVAAFDADSSANPHVVQGCLEAWCEVLDDLGHWQEMLRIAKRVAEIVSVDSAAGLTERAWALDRYGVALARCGQHNEALKQLREALTLEEQAASSNDIGVGRACNNLASVLVFVGRYAEAEPLFRRALSIVEQTLEPDDPTVGKALSNLGGVLTDTGRYVEAEPLCQRALVIVEKVLGPEHRDVANVYGNLIGLLRETGRYAEAERLARRALDIVENALGPKHPQVAEAYGRLASVLRDSGHNSDAEPLFRRALSIAEEVLGSEHPLVGIIIGDLAQTLSEAGTQADAESFWRHSLQLMQKNYGIAHDHYGRALWHYAEHLQRYGQTAVAQGTIAEAVAVLSQALGDEHPDTQRAKQTAAAIDG